MTARFFIDECLSAALAAIAKDCGRLAVFGPHLGMGGRQDWNIARFAVENDYVVVINNRRDFLREYLKYDTHPGLVVVVPHAERAVQIVLFTEILDLLDGSGDACDGMLIEVHAPGSTHVRRWNRDEHDIRHITSPGWQGA